MWSNPNPIKNFFKRLKWGFHRVLSKVWLTIDDSIKIVYQTGIFPWSTKGYKFSRGCGEWVLEKKESDFCVWQVRVCSNNGVKGAWSGLGFYWSKPPKQMKALFIEGGSWYRSNAEGKSFSAAWLSCCCCFSFGLKVVVEMLGAHEKDYTTHRRRPQ